MILLVSVELAGAEVFVDGDGFGAGGEVDAAVEVEVEAIHAAGEEGFDVAETEA